MGTSGELTRFSLSRLLLLIVFIGLVGLASYTIYKQPLKTSSAEQAAVDVWFVPYVDTTLTPTLHFEEPLDQPTPDVALAFIVADRLDGCQPSWGAYYDLDAAGRALDLDRRVARLRQRGGSAMVSFGGAINQELAISCQDPAALLTAYQAVVDRYKPSALDFDIEGASISNAAANARRAEAIRKLQEKDKDLEIWLTLPVDPNGLPGEALRLVEQTMAGGVKLRGVNVMTMDYGGSRGQMSMRAATLSALTATSQQLGRVFSAAGLTMSERDVWSRIGVTPMIGQNDIPGEVFSLADAHWLVEFASEKRIGRISSWSANRDGPCGAAASESLVSNTCSGVKQAQYEFATILGSSSKAGGARASNDGDDKTVKGPPAGRVSGVTGDDPVTSPYPVWRTAKGYEAGARVVWQARVYAAKWWTQGDQPDSPVKNPWETPWRYLGPVTEEDRQAVRATTLANPSGPRRLWERARIYVAGEEIEYSGQAYRAKWWTQGDQPSADPDSSYGHPWVYLGDVVKSTGALASAVTETPTATPTPEPTATLEPTATAVPTATRVPPRPSPTATATRAPAQQRGAPGGQPTATFFPRQY